MSEVITVSGASTTIYGTVAARDPYLLLSSRFTAAWTLLSADQRNRISVDATRYLNRRAWKGTKTSAVQALAWPRTHASDGDSNEIATNVIPEDIDEASYVLAGLIALNPDLLGGGNVQAQVQSLREGPISASFFYRSSVTGDDPGVVVIDEVENMIQGYLGDSTGNGFGDNLVPMVSGTGPDDGNESDFDNDKRYTILGGLS